MKPIYSAQSELFEAISNLQMDRIQELLLAGADPNERGFGGQTPLMWAIDAETGEYEEDLEELSSFYPPDSEICRLLLSFGADPSLREESGDSAFEHAKGPAYPDFVRHPKALELLTSHLGGEV